MTLEQRVPAADIFTYLAWATAVAATAGSLFFSEVMELPPCVLCWYQRIAMYPQIFVIGAAIATRDIGWKKYSLPLSLVGFSIAVYHNLLYYGLIDESLAPCVQGISCTSRQIEWFGFITIPFLSLSAFILILLFTILSGRKKDSEK